MGERLKPVCRLIDKGGFRSDFLLKVLTWMFVRDRWRAQRDSMDIGDSVFICVDVFQHHSHSGQLLQMHVFTCPYTHTGDDLGISAVSTMTE